MSSAQRTVLFQGVHVPLGSGEVIITVLPALVDSGGGICTLSALDVASRQIFNTLRPSSRVARLADQSTITSSGAEGQHATVAQLEVHQDCYTGGLTYPTVIATTGNAFEINELSPEVDGSQISARAAPAPVAGAAATEAAESPRPRLLNIRKRSEWEATWGFPGKRARRLLASANFGINSWVLRIGHGHG